MSYRVFARKYRPQTFEEVVGQEHITRTLQNAISNGRVAQAYLFVGPRGIGKTSTARILAKALNCTEGPSSEPCGKCDACQEIAEGRSLDVLEIDGASNNGVENIRELRENAAYAPARGPYKIYLIDEVHMLSAGAFNALLKTLEEPPAHVKFIFATTEAQKVPATITSRCQRFDLRRIPTEAIARHLQHIAKQESITLEEEAAQAIARGAEGGLRDAESMLDQAVAFCGQAITAADVMTVFGFTPRETIASLMGGILARDAAGSLGIIAQQAEAGKDLSRLLGDLIGHVRDLLVAAVGGGAAVPREKLLLLLDHFAETETRMRWATDRKLQFDVAVIKAVHLLDQASLDDVLDTLAALQDGSPPPPRSAPPAAPAVRSA
ncbi:MAG TPA: DNA polymerase III subunit gamma/tau, partial [Terrimicrobiaceae bacterium]|nr:DNA polymerase III subunit gamma/tau [Terrimicrobiaceae bacterium]